MWLRQPTRRSPPPRGDELAATPVRVFGIDIEVCARCGGKLKVIASIEEPGGIAKILAHLEKTVPDRHQSELPLGARAPPQQASWL